MGGSVLSQKKPIMRIFILFMVLYTATFSSLDDYISPEDSMYLKKKNNLKFAYIERSGSGKSYNDIYNEEIIDLFIKKTGKKVTIVKGTLEEIKKTDSIDIIIDPADEIQGYSDSPSINVAPYAFYRLKESKKKENDLLKNKKLAVLVGDKIPLNLFQRITGDTEIKTVKNIEEGFSLLRKNKIDLFFTLRDDIYMRLPEQKIFERVQQEKSIYLEKKIAVKSKDNNLKRIINAFVDNYSPLDKMEINEKASTRLIWKLIELTPEEREYLKNKNKINIGGFFKGLAPIMYFDNSNKVRGVVLEYINIFKYGADVEINFVPNYMNGRKSLEQQGRDLGIELFLVASREIDRKSLILTRPYYHCTMGIFGIDRMEDTFFRDLRELNEKKIGMAHESIKSFLKKDMNIEVLSANNISELYEMLKSGKIDYFIYDYNLMSNSMNKKGMNNLKLYGILDQDFTLSFATFKEDIILRNIMDKILNFVDNEEFFSKWVFKAQENPEDNPYRQWMIIFGVVLLFLVPYLLILKNEIEKRKKVETKLLETKKELENALNIKTAFLANMSHELKTPLTAILGFTKLLLKREDDLKKQQLLENIQVAGDTLVNFINNILDLSKLESGKVELKYIRINLRKMVDDIERICDGLNKSRGVVFNVSISENVPKYFMGDEVRLKEVILNVVNNAFKFTKSGKVELEFDSSDEKLFIKIKDTGMGIPKDKLDSIFERYQQLDLNENIEKKGFGLGLSIVKEILDMMDGNIYVESKHKEWTLFTITLPIKKKLELVGSIRGKSN